MKGLGARRREKVRRGHRGKCALSAESWLPKPQSIVELDTVRTLADRNHVVIACGGGIPGFKTEDNPLEGAAAGTDKGFAAEKRAEQLDADCHIMLN